MIENSGTEHGCDSLPIGWSITTLGLAIRPERPRGLPSNYPDSPFIGLEHVEAQTTRLLGTVPAHTMRSSGVRFQSGDVLYGRMRPYLNKVWLADRDGLCSGEFIVLPGAGSFAGGFLKYRLNAQDFVSFANRTTSGDRPRADFGDLASFPIWLPPRDEQCRIAERLDELFTDLTVGVAALERVKKKLKRYRSAVLHAAVTGRLTDPGKSSWHLEENWQNIGDVIGDIGQGWSPKCDLVPARSESEWAVMTTTAVQKMAFLSEENKRLPESLTPRPDLELRESDLLITRAGPRARCGVACLVRKTRSRLMLCDKAYRFRCRDDAVLPEYIELVLNARPITDMIERMKTGSSDSGLNLTQGRFRSLSIPLPLREIQLEIVEAVNEKLSQIDAMELEVERGLARAARLRQSILKFAFEGQLVPQNPNDEPASVLLERIQAERTLEAGANPKTKTKRPKSSAPANTGLFDSLETATAAHERRGRKAKGKA